ncbi:hypothetical protein BDQ12DRAFT_615434 [Crucibulum laeve]|uniref:Trichome birefringence-like C-terminal domain-containing protein n=1 Tax=Crucibulum laeve TaxID=68775 RepID=A0A5C3LKU6_9AGAR|nr:hypothetical protein BDQ12DRAFT_615434 [Crucibulum laeve]
MALIRRRRTIILVIVLCSAALLLVYRAAVDLESLGSKLLYDDDTEVSTDTEEPDSDLCYRNECTKGSWKLRSPPFESLVDFERVYPPTHRGIWKMCGSEENSREPEDRARFHATQADRMIDLMNYVWEPRTGRMREWRSEEFVVRLLKSPGGLIFNGDSISRQHFQWMEYALARSGVFITEDPPYLPRYDHKRIHQFILRKDHPMTKYLQERAGVPDSRMERPIYIKIDNHVLIGEADIRNITYSLGAKDGFKLYDIFDYFEDWENFVKDMVAAREGEEETVTEDSIILLNTGAHWSRGSWYMLPNDGDAFEQQSRITAAFREMVSRITIRLASIQRISIYYRSTSPGHPSCTKRSIPYSSSAAARAGEANVMERMAAATPDEQQKIVRKRWDWDRFDAHNMIWKNTIDEIMRARSYSTVNSKYKGPKWYYMDVWDQALQRPDAHTQNLIDPKNDNLDCLHWCVPGVVEQWTEYLNHLIFFNDESDR